MKNYKEDLVKEVIADFLRRQKERLSLERMWELCLNFANGKQFMYLTPRLEMQEKEKEHFWEERQVFNHIAPIIETRLAKLSKIHPIFAVKGEGGETLIKGSQATALKDTENKLIRIFERENLREAVSIATSWSEITGTAFYKITKCGEGVKILPLSPFEIYPDNLETENIENLRSVIHAKKLSRDEIKEKFGIDIDTKKEKKRRCFGKIEGSDELITVIERYERPSKEFPLGRRITVAGDKLVGTGVLPIFCSENGGHNCGGGCDKSGGDNVGGKVADGFGAFVFPFIKQESISVPGCFFGKSVVERLIPVQRAFNAVKNRKHEFLNRLTNGILKVEDGSVDTDDLESNGLAPGSMLIYRQGSTAPEMMKDYDMPDGFDKEEEKLLSEFTSLGGVADVSTMYTSANLTSGTALELLSRQDNERLVPTAERIRKCYLAIANYVIALILGGKMCGQVAVIENENELLYTESQKKERVLELYKSGLLENDKGKIDMEKKQKIIALLGFRDLI